MNLYAMALPLFCIIASVIMPLSLSAQTASDNQVEAGILQQVANDQDKVNQALNSGAITQAQADADNKRITDVRTQISKTHKKYQGLIPHKNLISINKALKNVESREKSQEMAKHKVF